MRTLADHRERAELLRRLRLLRPDQARRWGRMTAHQMVCHLSDAFRMATGEKVVGSEATLYNRTVLKWLALWAPVPWPPGIRTRYELDALQGGTPPAGFAEDLAEVEAQLERFLATPLDRRPHPYFGPLSLAAWLRWGWLHTDHHLRQFGA
jgi:hypothetical protein